MSDKYFEEDSDDMNEFLYDSKVFSGDPKEDLMPSIYEQRESMAYAVFDKIREKLSLGAVNQVYDILKSQGKSTEAYKKSQTIPTLKFNDRARVILAFSMKTGTYDDFARATSYLLSEKAHQRKE